jgi:DNA polymerase-3 subunit delta
VRPEDLETRLAQPLSGIYVVHGDEPLVALECGDAVRSAARRNGIDERETYVVEQHFKWDTLLAANASMGLFGTRRLIDLRIPSGKPGTEGGKALEAYAAKPNPDNVTLVTLPRLDKAAQASAWFTSLTERAVVVAVHPIERDALPRWIAGRLARQKQNASAETLAFLADLCEGNLLAARQEIEKLALLMPEGELAHDAVEAAVADVARFDVFAASEAWLLGDAARAARILVALQAEGDGPQLAIWALGEDLHALGAIQAMTREGIPIASALRSARVWGKRQQAMERAVRRMREDEVVRLLVALAHVDALSKGIGCGEAWDEILALALAVAGKPARPLSARM